MLKWLSVLCIGEDADVVCRYVSRYCLWRGSEYRVWVLIMNLGVRVGVVIYVDNGCGCSMGA